jgi:hypothetical protein
VTEGISDNIHSAALRIHVEKPVPDSSRVVDAALDLMLFLAPELREVLAHELCRSSVPGADLLDIFESWKNDPDDGVRQNIAVGVTQVLLREQAGRAEMTPEMNSWRTSVREDLLAYAPHMDANRRDAWLSMLMLNDLTLVDGLVETIGDPDEPGVDLSDIYEGPDALLVALVADRWVELQEHFGSSLMNRLSGSRLKPAEEERRLSRAVEALATAANRSSAIAELVESHLATDAGTEAQGLKLSIPVIQMMKRQHGSDPTTIKLVLESAERNQNHYDRSDAVTKWALTEFLEHDGWNVTTDDLRDVLAPRTTAKAPNDLTAGDGRGPTVADAIAQQRNAECWEPGDAWRDREFAFRRTIWSLLFPNDDLTQSWLVGLGSWFTSGAEPGHAPSTWLETAALTFGASPADHLPSLVERVFRPIRLEALRDSHWEVTVPLLHRLRQDPEAVEALRASLGKDVVDQQSALFSHVSTASAGPTDADGPESTYSLEAANVQRDFVSTLALRRIGRLEPTDLDTCLDVLKRSDPRTVVVDPFINRAGPVWTAGLALLRAR